MRFEGTYTALVTPFLAEAGEPVDWAALDALIDAQLAGGVDGLVPCGTTGESPTLDSAEHGKLIARAVAKARGQGRAKVIAGVGSSSTRDAVAMARHAEHAGADAVMVVSPPYNRPSQEGLARHFLEVARALGVPVVVYNIPGRTGADVAPETLARIAESAPNVLATKEATGNVIRAQKLKQLLGDRLTVLSGDDALTLPMIAVGAAGVISVTSNALPSDVVRATRLALDGKMADARAAHLALLPVHEAMFGDASPAPVKALLASRGVIRDVLRAPMAACSEPARRAVLEAAAIYAARAR